MIPKCEMVKEKLGAWLDGELAYPENRQVKEHLEGCPSCVAEQGRLRQLQSSLAAALQRSAADVSFETFWSGVEQKIKKKNPWRVQVMDWLGLAVPARGLAWAIPVVIVSLLGLLSMDQLFPEWPWGQNRNNRTAVESIDGHGLNVALFREYETKTTVIWLFENQEEQEVPSAEPIQDKDPF